MTIRPDILNELGLSPGWKLRALPADADAAEHSAPAPANNASVSGEFGAAAARALPAASVSEMDWDSLKAAVLGCEKCGLCKRRKQAVFGTGDIRADLFLAGEGPGRDEDRVGEPFVGRAGKLLDLMLAAVGMARGDGVYIANVVKCRPPENRNPTAGESGACMPYLDRQIALAAPACWWPWGASPPGACWTATSPSPACASGFTTAPGCRSSSPITRPICCATRPTSERRGRTSASFAAC